MPNFNALEITANYDDAYNKAYLAWDDFVPLAERDLRYFLGDQWDDQEKRSLYDENRHALVCNKIRPNINMVSGYQRKHRHSSIVLPLEGSDQLTSDQMTKLLLYIMQHSDGYECISDCFQGALITGWNLCSLWMDYREDPINGDIKFHREPYNAFITDPYFYKKDLSDCAYLLRRKYLSLEQAISLLPAHKKDLIALYNMGWERDDKFTWLPYQRQPNGQKMIAYDEYWEQGFESVDLLLDTATGKEYEWDGNQAALVMSSDLQVISKTMPYVYQHIICNGKYIQSEKNPYGLNEYPFVPFFAIFQPESDQWGLKIQSLVRPQIDPQRESNKRRSQMVDLIESQINSGWIATEGSTVNPRSLFQTSQGKVIWKKADAAPDAIVKIPPGQIPPSFFQLQEVFDRDIGGVANISEELLGQADNEQDSGLKVALRQGAALVGLQDLFDNLRFSQELMSRKALKMMQSWTPEKMKRILNEEPTEALRNKQTLKYDIAVQEGILTDTQQQMFFRQLIALKELGEPMPPMLLARAAPLQGKTEYLKAMEEFTKQQQEAAQQQQKIQNQILQTQSEMAQAKALSDVALSKERFTRAVANMGLEDERASKAVENRADAVLRRAQAAKQLESMDDDRLIKLLEMFNKLEELNAMKETQIKADDVAISAQAEQPNNTEQEVSNAR